MNSLPLCILVPVTSYGPNGISLVRSDNGNGNSYGPRLLPNFSVKHKLMNKIDKNWHSKFTFLQWELCKTLIYLNALERDR